MATPFYVYHWTHRNNLASIYADGLDPSYATGEKPWVWACVEARAAWALVHIATRHGWNPDEMVCIRLVCREDEWEPYGTTGVYYSRLVVSSSRFRCCRPGPLADWQQVSKVVHGR